MTAAAAATPDGRTVQLKRIRLSFTESLYEKQATVDDGTPKYNFNIIIENGQPESERNLELIRNAIKAAGQEKWGAPDKHKLISEDNPKRVCFRKGERFRNKDGEVYGGYEGNWGMSVGCPGKGQKRPKLLDRHKRAVEEKDILDVFYGGTYADVFVSFFGTDKGGAGIFCTADGIRSHQEGERIGGGGLNVTGDMFDDLEGDIPAAGGSAAGSTTSDNDFD